MKKWIFGFLFCLIFPSMLWAAFGVDTIETPASVDTISNPASVDTITAADPYKQYITVFLGAEGTCPTCPSNGAVGTYYLHATEDYDAHTNTTADLDNGATLDSSTELNGDQSWDFNGPSSRLDDFTLSEGTNYEADGGIIAGVVRYDGAWCTAGNQIVNPRNGSTDYLLFSCYDDSGDEGFRLRIYEATLKVADLSDTTADRYEYGSVYKFAIYYKTDAASGSDYLKLYIDHDNDGDLDLVAEDTNETFEPDDWDNWDTLLLGDNGGYAGNKTLDNFIIVNDNSIPLATIENWLDKDDYSEI